MEFNFKKAGNTVIVYLKGRLDVNYSAEIEKEMGKLIAFESGSHFLINMKDVQYVSSSGLRIFVLFVKALKEDGRKFVLCNINNTIKKVFEVIQITDMFHIFNSEDEAMQFLKGIDLKKQD